MTFGNDRGSGLPIDFSKLKSRSESGRLSVFWMRQLIRGKIQNPEINFFPLDRSRPQFRQRPQFHQQLYEAFSSRFSNSARLIIFPLRRWVISDQNL